MNRKTPLARRAVESPVRPFEITITPGPDQATATRAETDAALGALFLGLTNAIKRGYEVDLSDPRRIVVRGELLTSARETS
ncbi:hypothetical protein [uncultured Lamprocystis sp.]|jgi:hypothetical protein|uniref:hypothetical protein n=1 Tax=uncultured Lamprocystis sp. TaxID=543132 RepID=UPI0025FC4079|nr:hypothetical protein [uncultured Lamprocystis sp.]